MNRTTQLKPSSSEAQAVPRLPITCSSLERFTDKPPCCSSCHEDAEMGYMELCGDGSNWAVCCAVASWLSDAGIDTSSDRDTTRVRSAHCAAKLQQPPERSNEAQAEKELDND